MIITLFYHCLVSKFCFIFSLLHTNSQVVKPAYQRNRFRFNQIRQRQALQRQNREASQSTNQPLTKLEKKKERERQRLQRNMQKQYGQSKFRFIEKNFNQQQKRRDASVAVHESWEVSYVGFEARFFSIVFTFYWKLWSFA